MSLHGEHGSAWRRRHGRLRSWWRHEQQSVAMAMFAAAHHTFDKVAAGEKYDGLRAQKTDRAGEAANKALRRQKSKAAGEAVFFEVFDEDTARRHTGCVSSSIFGSDSHKGLAHNSHCSRAFLPGYLQAWPCVSPVTVSETAHSPWSPRQVASGALPGSSRAWPGSAFCCQGFAEG